MINNEQYLQLIELMDKYTALFRELAPIEEAKTAAARDFDLEKLDECMKREQAFVLRMKGYEKRREPLLRELNLEGVRLSQLAERCPEEFRGRLSEVCRELMSSYHGFKAYFDCAAKMVEVRGEAIGEAIVRANAKSAKERTYDAKGRLEPDGPRSLGSRKV